LKIKPLCKKQRFFGFSETAKKKTPKCFKIEETPNCFFDKTGALPFFIDPRWNRPVPPDPYPAFPSCFDSLLGLSKERSFFPRFTNDEIRKLLRKTHHNIRFFFGRIYSVILYELISELAEPRASPNYAVLVPGLPVIYLLTDFKILTLANYESFFA